MEKNVKDWNIESNVCGREPEKVPSLCVKGSRKNVLGKTGSSS